MENFEIMKSGVYRKLPNIWNYEGSSWNAQKTQKKWAKG